MQILKVQEALSTARRENGLAYIAEQPTYRSGKKEYVAGEFFYRSVTIPFRSWEDSVLYNLKTNGTGIYIVEVEGTSYNGTEYLNLRSAIPYTGQEYTVSDFLLGIERAELEKNFQNILHKLEQRGLSATGYKLMEEVIQDPQLEGRFALEGAAVRHHDNIIGGLWHHTNKMLNLFVTLLDNNPELRDYTDLLAFSILVHDIGKVFEYDNLKMSKYWYANHRVRGIEFLASWKDRLLADYDENFYRQVQSVIAGHHGEYGDRPTTVAAAIVHFIDSTESQITELVRGQITSLSDRVSHPEWRSLQKLPKLPQNKQISLDLRTMELK